MSKIANDSRDHLARLTQLIYCMVQLHPGFPEVYEALLHAVEVSVTALCSTTLYLVCFLCALYSLRFFAQSKTLFYVLGSTEAVCRPDRADASGTPTGVVVVLVASTSQQSPLVHADAVLAAEIEHGQDRAGEPGQHLLHELCYTVSLHV